MLNEGAVAVVRAPHTHVHGDDAIPPNEGGKGE
jgi:hypothetical protein